MRAWRRRGHEGWSSGRQLEILQIATMYLPIPWRKSICGWEGEGSVKGDIFIILLLSHLKRTNRTGYKAVGFAPQRRSRIIIYEVNLPSYVIDAVVDTSAWTSDTIIHCAFVGCYSDSGPSGDLCQRCLLAPKALIFGVRYRGVFIQNDTAIIGVTEEYGGTSWEIGAAKRQRPTMHNTTLTPDALVFKSSRPEYIARSALPSSPMSLLLPMACRGRQVIGGNGCRRLCDRAVVAFSKDSPAMSDNANAFAIRPACAR